MNQRGFSSLLVIVLALVIIGGIAGYFVITKKAEISTKPDKITAKPIVNLQVEPSEISKGGSATLIWSTENAVTCEASSPTVPDLPFRMNWSGSVELSGSKVYNNIPHDLFFELTCKNSIGDSTFAKVLVTVKPEQPAPAQLPVTPVLSADKKSIVADGKVLLAIDNDTIFNWFKIESQLCNEYNITTTADRKSFCENKTSFKNLTRFVSIVVSPDKMKIGFTIESDTLSPDKVVGIFLRSANAVHLLGGYYLGNEFISFSPNGTNFVYKGGCFEGMCGLYVKNSETLANKASLSDSEFADARTRTATFVRWISDNKIEYKLGTELKQASF